MLAALVISASTFTGYLLARTAASLIVLAACCCSSFFVSDNSLSQFYLKASRRVRMQMPSSISAAMNRTLFALSRASFKADTPSPPRGFFFFLFFTPQPLHFYNLLLFPPFRFGLLCYGFGGAWALSGSSKQAQIMNRVRKQLAEKTRE